MPFARPEKIIRILFTLRFLYATCTLLVSYNKKSRDKNTIFETKKKVYSLQPMGEFKKKSLNWFACVRQLKKIEKGKGSICFLKLSPFLYLVYSFHFFLFWQNGLNGPRKSYDVALKTRKLLKGTLSDLINVLTRRLLSFYFVLPSKKIAFSFHNRFFFLLQKLGNLQQDHLGLCRVSICRGRTTHTHSTLSLCATLCKRQRNPHNNNKKKNNDGLMFVGVCVCVIWDHPV